MFKSPLVNISYIGRFPHRYRYRVGTFRFSVESFRLTLISMLEPIHFQILSAITLELQINRWAWARRTCIEVDIGIDVEIVHVNTPLKGYRDTLGFINHKNFPHDSNYHATDSLLEMVHLFYTELREVGDLRHQPLRKVNGNFNFSFKLSVMYWPHFPLFYLKWCWRSSVDYGQSLSGINCLWWFTFWKSILGK